MFDDMTVTTTNDDQKRARHIAEALSRAESIPATYHQLAAQALAAGDDAKARADVMPTSLPEPLRKEWTLER